MASRKVLSAASLVIMSLILIISLSEAKDFVVGGKTDSWQIPPSSQSQLLNQWAQSSRFKIGDSLVWKYEAGKDSVLQVTRESYLNCNLTNPIAEYNKDGNTKIVLEKSGPYYFISGAKGHCEKGQKVIVVVMAPRSGGAASPAPSPAAGLDGPAVAPTSGVNGGGSSRLGFLVMIMSVVAMSLVV